MTATERRFLEGVRAGLIATLAMSVVMVISNLLASSILPEPIPLALIASLLAKLFRTDTVTTPEILLATLLHFAYGAFWFGMLAVSVFRVTWKKGLVIAFGLWLIMFVFMLPLAGAPVFDVVTKPGMWIMTLLMHAVYGVTGGLVMQRRDQYREFPRTA